MGVALGRGDILLFGADKTPNFVHLNALAIEVHEHAVLIPSSGHAGIHGQLRDRRFAEPGEAGHSTDAVAFAEKVKDAGAIGGRELVHVQTIAQSMAKSSMKDSLTNFEIG